MTLKQGAAAAIHAVRGSNKMNDVRYELDGQLFVWDSVKYDMNVKKHKVNFEEAATVFMGENTEYYKDKEHSDDEERFIIVGNSDQLRALMVCHCLRENETVIRIISARKAGKYEEKRKWR